MKVKLLNSIKNWFWDLPATHTWNMNDPYTLTCKECKYSITESTTSPDRYGFPIWVPRVKHHYDDYDGHPTCNEKVMSEVLE